VSGEATKTNNLGAYNLQSVFSHGDGLGATAAQRVVGVLNGAATDNVTAVVVTAAMAIPIAPEAAGAVASILELTSTTSASQVTNALSNLPIAESLGSGTLRDVVGSIQTVLSTSATTADKNGLTGSARVTAAMIWMFWDRS
jgi:hypothetical protein